MLSVVWEVICVMGARVGLLCAPMARFLIVHVHAAICRNSAVLAISMRERRAYLPSTSSGKSFLQVANPDLPLYKLGSSTPKKISGIPPVKKIVTNKNGSASLAITKDDELWSLSYSWVDGADAPVKISQ